MSRICFILAAMLCARSVAAQTVVRPEPPLDAARATLKDALVGLRDSLSSIDASHEGVRGYGNDRAGRIQAAVRRYSQVAGGFLAALGIKVLPMGAESRPLAS